MSKRIKIVTLFICFSLILSSGAAIANHGVLQKYAMMDETTMYNDLKALNLEQLVSEINNMAIALEKTNDINFLIPFATELFQRKDDIKDTDILSTIKDNTKSLTIRELMVDLYLLKHEKQPIQDELKAILNDQNTDKRIKERIVASSTFSKSDVSLLKELIAKDDGLIAFNSLKALSKVDDNAAYQIASGILSDIDAVSKDKLAAALKSTAKYFKHIKSNDQDYIELENEFLNLSLELISNSEDIYIKDSAFFSISEIGSKQSISKILESNFIDRELKVFAVDQNFMTLEKMLLDKPTEADIKIVVTAMELLPVVDLTKALEEATKSIENVDLKQQCEAALKIMKENGVRGNQKWLDNN